MREEDSFEQFDEGGYLDYLMDLEKDNKAEFEFEKINEHFGIYKSKKEELSQWK